MLEIKVLTESCAAATSQLMKENKEDLAFFHPHSDSCEEIRIIFANAIINIYAGVYIAGALVGYGMLRGWDDGFDVPSLGILIDRKWRGRGIFKMLMTYLHTSAKINGAEKVRLTVYETNPAYEMYKNLGYVFDEGYLKDGIKQGFINL